MPKHDEEIFKSVSQNVYSLASFKVC